MRYLITMTFIGMLFLVACKDIHNTHRLRAVRNQNDKIKKHLILDNPFSHFPSNNDLNFINARLLIPNETGSDSSRTHRAYSILICGMRDSAVNIPKDYIKKSKSHKMVSFPENSISGQYVCL